MFNLTEVQHFNIQPQFSAFEIIRQTKKKSAAAYGRSIATASSQSESKLEPKPPAIKNRAWNKYVYKTLKSLNRIFIFGKNIFKK